MDRPVCLIENQEENRLVVNQKALQILDNINQPVVVVAIVGKYRTGKSYLMNKLAGQRKGFALGSTVESKTKGIWMWCVPHPTMDGHTLVLLDTEGLGDVEKGDSKNDSWIFSLAVLLSSTLIYNSVGTIDQQTMDQLQYVTELTELIKVKSPSQNIEENDGADFKRFFPSFIWCVRDFTLVLEKDGKTITEDEYLQNSLALKTGNGRKIVEYNLPRECIHNYFHSHKCFVFERPANKEGLNNMDHIPESQLEPGFLCQTEKFLSHVYKNSKIKTLAGGYQMNGRLLGNLAVTYVEAILSGSVPCMENVILTLAELQNSRAVTEAVSKYESKMNEKIDQFPTETQEDFFKLHQESKKEAVKIFKNQSFKDENQEFQDKFSEKLETKFNSFLKCNEEKSKKKCLELLQNLNKTIETEILEGKYFRPGGYMEFLEKKTKLVDEYNKTAGGLLKASETLQLFLSEKTTIERAIMQADKTLTKKEKELAEQEVKIKAAEMINKLKKENENKIKELLEIQKKSNEQQIEMLKKKTEEDQENVKRENEKLIERKLEEMRMYDQCMTSTRELERELEKFMEAMKKASPPPPPPCTIS